MLWHSVYAHICSLLHQRRNVIERPPVSPSPQTENKNMFFFKIEGNHCVVIYFVHLEIKTPTCTLLISLDKTAKYFVSIVSSLCIHPPQPNKWTEEGPGMKMRMRASASASHWGQIIQKTLVWPSTPITLWDRKFSRQTLLPQC